MRRLLITGTCQFLRNFYVSRGLKTLKMVGEKKLGNCTMYFGIKVINSMITSGAIPIPNPKKLIKSTRNKFLIYPGMKRFSSNSKKMLIFSQKKAFLLFSQKKTFLIFPEMKPFTFQSKLSK